MFGSVSPTVCASIYHHGTVVNQDLATGMLVRQGGRLRKLTHVELERLQGFPDGWTHGSDASRYRMVGNAVAVPVAEWIVRGIRRAHG